MGSKIAFYVDVNVISLSNLTILKADISKKKKARNGIDFFSFSYAVHSYAKNKKKFYREANYVHLALTYTVLSNRHIILFSGPEVEQLRALFLNHSNISPLRLVWVRAPYCPHVNKPSSACGCVRCFFSGSRFCPPTVPSHMS